MSQTLTHKGYEGSVAFSAEDRLLYGHILGIRDMVAYDGTDVESLDRNFQDAVDEYLRFCAEEGKVPDVPYKGTFNVRVGPDLHKRAALLAEARKTKLNKVVQAALEDYLLRAG